MTIKSWFMKDIKDLNKWKDVPYPWIKRQYHKQNKLTIRKLLFNRKKGKE